MPITPDVKDWTWVVEKPCSACGFAASQTSPADVGPTIRSHIPRWRKALERTDVAVRPDDSTWSTLEYAAHVRDVFGVFEQRLRLMLAEDGPDFADWDQDAAAVDGDYAGQRPSAVAAELDTAGQASASTYDAVRREQWGRTGRRSNGAQFTVQTLSQYLLHDLVHHLHDVDA